MTDEMTDTEIMWLRTDIEYHDSELVRLQERHRSQTGQNHIPSFRLDPPKATIKPCVCGCGDFVIVGAKK
jgi:hypothetical protein